MELETEALALLRGVELSGRSVRLLGLTVSNPPEELRPGMWVQQWLDFDPASLELKLL